MVPKLWGAHRKSMLPTELTVGIDASGLILGIMWRNDDEAVKTNRARSRS